MTQTKYRLLPWEQTHFRGLIEAEIPVKARRIQALIDIPEHNVKAGDIGGFVSSRKNLSHEGNCWIADDAIVYKYAIVKDNALVSGYANVINLFKKSILTVKDNAVITDEADVAIIGRNIKKDVHIMSIGGNTRIMGDATVYNVRVITDDVLITDHAYIIDARKINGKTVIKDGAKINQGVTISNSDISGNAIIGENTIITNSKATMGARVPEKCVINDSVIDQGMDLQNGQWVNSKNNSSLIPIQEAPIANMELSMEQEEADANNLMELFAMLKADIATYETDIAKIIQYPVMVDKTDPYTAKMFMSLKRATMLSVTPNHRFNNALQELGEAFLAAESNAMRIRTTLLSEDAIKKTTKAKDLLSIASNEASSEHEKKTSFVQGFKTLEGVLPVPDIAKDTFRAKIGLKEIEVGA